MVFKVQADPGTIIVSFADRKLYFVLPNYRAISYPIGAPMGEARWEGVLHVSEKRIDPLWTPTADMRRENPTLPAYVPGGHPLNPLGPRAMYLGNTPTAPRAPMRPGLSARTSPQAASACTITT